MSSILFLMSAGAAKRILLPFYPAADYIVWSLV